MFGTYHPTTPKRIAPSSTSGQRLIGYFLYPRNFEPGKEAILRLEDRCLNAGYKLFTTECEMGVPTNPFRQGLWRALRRLVCAKCEPKRMSFSMINFDDFLHQALSPCGCREPFGVNGIVVTKMEHITPDKTKSGEFILIMAKLGKHVIAADGICLSCCHPATKELLVKSALNMVNKVG